MIFNILIVEDDSRHIDEIKKQIESEFDRLLHPDNDEIPVSICFFEAKSFLEVTNLDFDLISKLGCAIIDYNLGTGRTGFDVLVWLKQRNGGTFSILRTGWAGHDSKILIDKLRDFNRVGCDFWIEKGAENSVEDLLLGVDYSIRRYIDPTAPFRSIAPSMHIQERTNQ